MNQTKQTTINRSMEFFARAKAVRLRSHHEKFLVADDDEEHVIQDRDGSSRRARWHVEIVENQAHLIRLKSCYGRYLSASNEPFLLGWTGRKVLQTLPRRLDSSLEWEPIRDGCLVKLKTRYGNFLRANGGLPPWRNSVTHDVPSRTVTQDWVLWDVDVVEIRVEKLRPPPPPPAEMEDDEDDYEPLPPPPPPHLRSGSGSPPKLSKLESSSSFSGSPPKMDGRTIYYSVADDHGEIDETVEVPSISFKGISVEELKNKLQEETGISDIFICFRNPVDGRLNPLRLHLPPNNTTMHVVVVPASSKVGRSFNR